MGRLLSTERRLRKNPKDVEVYKRAIEDVIERIVAPTRIGKSQEGTESKDWY